MALAVGCSESARFSTAVVRRERLLRGVPLHPLLDEKEHVMANTITMGPTPRPCMRDPRQPTGDKCPAPDEVSILPTSACADLTS